MEIICTLAGANFRPGDAREVCRHLTIGEILDLEADPGNEYDANAVRVIADGTFIGFIPRSDNGAISQLLATGETLTAEVIGFESSLKPILSIELP